MMMDQDGAERTGVPQAPVVQKHVVALVPFCTMSPCRSTAANTCLSVCSVRQSCTSWQDRLRLL
jgi:hypothetical protein